VIIDIHGHSTTVPKGLADYRQAQIERLHNPTRGTLSVSDDETGETIQTDG